jgi:adenine phosphoribosyltransferase
LSGARPDATLDLTRFIREVPDFPKRGIRFKDITPLLLSPEALAEAVRRMAAFTNPPEAVVAVESRGFIFGAGLALHWGVPLVPARKFGKLPGKTVRQIYSLEYGEDSLELHADSLRSGQRAVIVDDVLATGGTAAATTRLVEELDAKVQGLIFLIELAGLQGRAKLSGHAVHALMEMEAG